jgi:TonB family protein
MTVRGIAILPGVLAALLLGCATPRSAPPAASANSSPPPLRMLPHAQIDTKRDWYPWQGRLQNLEGQTVVRFQIDRGGKATGIKVVASDAAPLLQVTAVQLIQSAHFDLTSVPYQASNPNPFLVGVVFCIQRCENRPPYPGTSDTIVITGSQR